ALRFVADTDDMLPCAVRRNVAVGVMGEVIGVANGETERMSTTAAGIEIKLLAAGSVTIGDDACACDLSAAVTPGLDRERGVVGKSVKIDSLDISNVTIGRSKLANAGGKIGIVGIIPGQSEIDVEVLAVMAAPGIVRNGVIGLVQSPVGYWIVGND